jgi:ethanolamine utilization microcompartment shell protein EutS
MNNEKIKSHKRTTHTETHIRAATAGKQVTAAHASWHASNDLNVGAAAHPEVFTEGSPLFTE